MCRCTLKMCDIFMDFEDYAHAHARTHTHTHIHTHVCIYVCMYVTSVKIGYFISDFISIIEQTIFYSLKLWQVNRMERSPRSVLSPDSFQFNMRLSEIFSRSSLVINWYALPDELTRARKYENNDRPHPPAPTQGAQSGAIGLKPTSPIVIPAAVTIGIHQNNSQNSTYCYRIANGIQ